MEYSGRQEEGTRSWSVTPSYKEDNLVYVQASQFYSKICKYSDGLPSGAETLLKGIVIAVYKELVRVKFSIDDTYSSIKTIKTSDLVVVTEENKHLIYYVKGK